MTIVFTPEGQARCVYTEQIDLRQLGKLDIKRATTIEPHLNGWKATILDAPKGNYFYAPTRQQCMDWEVQYLESRLCEDPHS